MVTSLVAVWHGVVALFQVTAKIPGCAGLTPLATKLLADQEKVDTDSSKVVQVLAQISAIKLPQGK